MSQRHIGDCRHHGEHVAHAVRKLSVHHRDLALRQDGLRRFDHRIHHAGDIAGLVADRAVAKGEIRLFRITVSPDDQRKILDERGFTRIGPLDHGLEVGPDFGPYIIEAPADRIGLIAEDRQESVVVKGGQRLAPDDRFRKVRGKHHAEGCPERLRPHIHRPERRDGPVPRHDRIRGPATARQKQGIFHDEPSPPPGTMTARSYLRRCDHATVSSPPEGCGEGELALPHHAYGRNARAMGHGHEACQARHADADIGPCDVSMAADIEVFGRAFVQAISRSASATRAISLSSFRIAGVSLTCCSA